MPTVGILNVAIKGSAQGLSNAVGKAERRLGSFRNVVRGVGVAVAAVGAGKLVQEFRETAEAIDATNKTARRLGIATEKLIGLRVAAARSGVEARTLELALQRLTRRTAEAAQGGGTASKAIRELGLSAEQLVRMPLEAQLGSIADALQRVPTQADKVRLAFKLFDSEGVRLIQMLENGSGALRQFQREAEQLGLTFSAEEAAKIEAVNDNLARLSDLLGGIKQGIVIKLGPRVLEFLEGLEALLREADAGTPGARGPQTAGEALTSPGFLAAATARAFSSRGIFGEGNIVFESVLQSRALSGLPAATAAEIQQRFAESGFFGASGFTNRINDMVGSAGDLANTFAGRTGSVLESAQKAAQGIRGPLLQEALKSAFGLRQFNDHLGKIERQRLDTAFAEWLANIDQSIEERFRQQDIFRPAIGALEQGSIAAASKIADIFAAERSMDTERKQLEEQKRARELLQEIDRTLRERAAAVAVRGIA